MIQVKKVIEKNINSCTECPYFFSHPQESSCDHPTIKKSADIWLGVKIIGNNFRNEIPELCPLRAEQGDYR